MWGGGLRSSGLDVACLAWEAEEAGGEGAGNGLRIDVGGEVVGAELLVVQREACRGACGGGGHERWWWCGGGEMGGISFRGGSTG